MKKELIALCNQLNKVGLKSYASNIASIYKIADKKSECPKATQDKDENDKNKKSAIKSLMYGPFSESSEFWEKISKEWGVEEKNAKKRLCGNCVAFDVSPRMEECMSGKVVTEKEIKDSIKNDEKWEAIGYCWMHHFKCKSTRTCKTWVEGGPITSDKVSLKKSK